jgi:hypothetical protein
MEKIDIKNIEEEDNFFKQYIEIDKNRNIENITDITDITNIPNIPNIPNIENSIFLSKNNQDILKFNENITSIKNINIEQILKKGKKILKENEFFKDLDNMMNDKKFRTFYEKYFKDIVDIKVILLYMKLYETIQKEYFAIHNCEIDNKLLAYMIKELMNNNMSRDKIMKSFHNFLEREIEPKNRNNYKKFLLDFLDKKNK